MKKLKIAFINPPHMDWCLANNITWLMMQSYYNVYGKYKDQIEWVEAPYKWNVYQTDQEVIDEVGNPDIVLFSSYAWNYMLVDRISKLMIAQNPNVITVLGGPHIGTKEKELLDSRMHYNFICQPTKPGETFLTDLIDSWFDNNGAPQIDDISWELRSFKKASCPFLKTSVYEEHYDYFKKTKDYADQFELEPFIILETTRGCPFKCTFCEWGGGIDTKIIKKDIDVVFKDIDVIAGLGYQDVYLTDANFGAFFERDIDIFRYATNKGLRLTDVSTVKSKDLKKKIKLMDAWFDVVGKVGRGEKEKLPVPHVSIQSLSDEAMTICKRVDLSYVDKIKLSEHVRQRCHEEGYPIPNPEFILGMPGSTLADFYKEFEVIWNFRSWGMIRHQYMFLPDTELSDPAYLKKYQIELIEIYNDIADEEGIENSTELYRNNRYYYKTARSCFSYTSKELEEMFFMNVAGPLVLKHLYENFEDIMPVDKFVKECYHIFLTLEDFQPVFVDIKNIFDPMSPPQTIKRLCGEIKEKLIQDLFEKNKILIYSSLMSETLLAEETV